MTPTAAPPLRPAPPWRAPLAGGPIRATVGVPGSKSETNRALILASLAAGPSAISNGLVARDTQLMQDGLRTLGVQIADAGNRWTVIPPARFRAGGRVDCGLAGTVMRFLPPVAALAPGRVTFDGDDQAYGRPMGSLLEALQALGAGVEGERSLPFALTGRPDLPGGAVTVDASASSQFVSGLLLPGARYAAGIDLRHEGPELPSRPHVDMTVAMLRARGVAVDDHQPDRWVVSPGPIAPADVEIEPDLSNAAPFLAAAVVTGGSVTVPGWPDGTNQPGDRLRDIFTQFGAEVSRDASGCTVRGTGVVRGVDLDLRAASELTPVVAAVAALADSPSSLRGVAHIRGHETDRLAALRAELEGLGGRVEETPDGLTIYPRPMRGGLWRSYADHRLAQAGALLGLVVDDIEIDDISATSKTLPQFAALWRAMVENSAGASADRDR